MAHINVSLPVFIEDEVPEVWDDEYRYRAWVHTGNRRDIYRTKPHTSQDEAHKDARKWIRKWASAKRDHALTTGA